MARAVTVWGDGLGSDGVLRAKIRRRRLLMSITTTEITTFLESHPPFSALPATVLHDLAQQCALHSHEAGEVVYSAGDRAAWLYVVYSGAVAVTARARRAGRGSRELTRLQPGDFCGGRALLEGARHLDTVTPLQATELLALERGIVIRLAREHAPIAARIRLNTRSMQLLRKRGRQPGLRAQEAVTLLCVPHWPWLALRMLFPLFLLGGAAFGAAGLAVNGLPWWPLILASGVAFPAWVALLVVDWRDDAYLVTDRRVVSDERLMIIHKMRAEAPLKRVRAVEITQGAIEQVFGYGDVVIQAFAG
ncbi:MAG TPA: cyclic nucleotide-binding domain-containing protein, partial [Anaerolineales bacterium]|nr:cyclic nucleotide-binding domain-containing protein [Anaerolineales bacterium]